MTVPSFVFNDPFSAQIWAGLEFLEYILSLIIHYKIDLDVTQPRQLLRLLHQLLLSITFHFLESLLVLIVDGVHHRPGF